MKLIETCEMAKITISERCNMICPFCTHPPQRTFELSPTEIGDLARLFKNAGMNKVKLCGGVYGEPLVRTDILEIVSRVRDAGIESVGIATNGLALTRDLAISLAAAGVTWITHSVTTLNPDTFRSLYQRDLRQTSFEAISAASSFERYQLNCVLLKGKNDAELDAIMELGHSNSAYVQFMELVELDDNRAFFNEYFLDAEPLKALLQSRCSEYYYNKGNMRHQYQLPTGVVTVKQTRYERSACQSCKRIFCNSEGKVWFCYQSNVLVDIKINPQILNAPTTLEDSIARRFNAGTDDRLQERMLRGCHHACD